MSLDPRKRFERESFALRKLSPQEIQGPFGFWQFPFLSFLEELRNKLHAPTTPGMPTAPPVTVSPPIEVSPPITVTVPQAPTIPSGPVTITLPTPGAPAPGAPPPTPTPTPTPQITTAVIHVEGASPVAGATVNLGGTTGVTDSSGNITLVGLPSGPATLSIDAPGFVHHGEQVQLTPGQFNYTVTLTKVPPGPPTLSDVSISVVDDASGQPISAATVTLGSQSASAPGGTATFPGMRLGTYTVSASAPGYQAATTTINITGTTFSTVLRLVKLAPVTVSGVVMAVDSSSGSPISGASISLGGSSLTTDSSGTVHFTGLSLGPTSLAVSAPGYQPFSQPVTIGSGQFTDGFSFRAPLSKVVAQTVSGSVLVVDSATSAPISGASVSLGGQSSTTDSGGRVQFSNLQPTSSALSISASGYNPFSQSVTLGSGAFGNGFSFRAALAKVATTVSQGNGAVIVLDAASGQPISGATVALGPASQTTDGTGTARFTLPQGNYTYLVSAPNYDQNGGNLTIGPTPFTQTVRLTAAVVNVQTVLVQVLALNNTTGNPIPGATASVGGVSGVTDSGGFVTLTVNPKTAGPNPSVTASAPGFSSGSGIAQYGGGPSYPANVSVIVRLSPVTAPTSIATVPTPTVTKAATTTTTAATPTGSPAAVTSISKPTAMQRLRAFQTHNLQPGGLGPGAPTATITTRVLDSQTGKPLSAAMVAYPEYGVSGLTNESGYVTLLVPPGQTSFTVSRSGYRPARGTTVLPGVAVTDSVYLTPLAPPPQTSRLAI